MRGSRRFVRTLLVVALVPLVISTTPLPAQAEAVTISKSGYYGRLVSWGYVLCANNTGTLGGNQRAMLAPVTWITKSRRFPASQQRLFVRHKIEYFDFTPVTGGWKLWAWGQLREGTYDPVKSALYGRRVFRMPAHQFYMDATYYQVFRISTQYRYVRYGRRIGVVRNMYDQFSHATQATSSPSPYFEELGYAVPTYCVFPLQPYG